MQTERRGSAFQSARGKRELESVFLFVTGKCNAKCTMCFYAGDMGERSSDLSFEEIKKLSETAPPFKRLWLSGGEPTLREDLPGIVELFYKNNHITDVNMPTNGIKTERILEWISRIRANCPKANVTVSISLDGFGATHDTQRGVPCFYEAAETLSRVHERFGGDGQVLTNIATVITKYNVDEVVDFMLWVYGRFNVTTHTIEAARGVTREEGVKVLTEKSLREIQDRVVPYYVGYGDRIAAGVKGRFGKWMARFFYLGLMRSMYNIRAENLEKPVPWKMDCTAGETTLVIDYDGRFRSCVMLKTMAAMCPPFCGVRPCGKRSRP